MKCQRKNKNHDFFISLEFLYISEHVSCKTEKTVNMET